MPVDIEVVAMDVRAKLIQQGVDIPVNGVIALLQTIQECNYDITRTDSTNTVDVNTVVQTVLDNCDNTDIAAALSVTDFNSAQIGWLLSNKMVI